VITKHPWFRFNRDSITNFPFRPVCWQGWAAIAIFAIGGAGLGFYYNDGSIAAIVFLVMIIFVFLTSSEHPNL
jgi:uncharacterized membrane protein